MVWGLATVILSPPKLLVQFQRVYFKCLPLLNVNCHIVLPWRLIPERYQGLGMANYALVSLASKLSFLQCNWGFSTSHLTAMMMGTNCLWSRWVRTEIQWVTIARDIQCWQQAILGLKTLWNWFHILMSSWTLMGTSIWSLFDEATNPSCQNFCVLESLIRLIMCLWT